MFKRTLRYMRRSPKDPHAMMRALLLRLYDGPCPLPIGSDAAHHRRLVAKEDNKSIPYAMRHTRYSVDEPREVDGGIALGPIKAPASICKQCHQPPTAVVLIVAQRHVARHRRPVLVEGMPRTRLG